MGCKIGFQGDQKCADKMAKEEKANVTVEATRCTANFEGGGRCQEPRNPRDAALELEKAVSPEPPVDFQPPEL